MALIQKIHARQILDSRGTPTIEAEVFLGDGSVGHASVPSGASTGEHEATELRDNNPLEYNGKSVHIAISGIHNIIAPKVIGLEAFGQQKIDQTMIELDSTPNKSKLGANAILAVSLATAVAAAKSARIPLYQYLSSLTDSSRFPYSMPYGMFNIFNGGRHAANSSDFQEYSIVPMQSISFARRLQCADEIFQALKKVLETKKLPTTTGDEGGYATPVSSNSEPLDFCMEAIRAAGYKPGEDVFFAIDVAASEFFLNNEYQLKSEKKTLDAAGMVAYFQTFADRYPMVSFEDPLEENDFTGFTQVTQTIGRRTQIVGDDLYTTNVQRLQTGITQHSTTAILIKLNQIGTLTETVNCIKTAQQAGMKFIISHRSGETEDTFIADFAVAMRAPQIKMGSLSRSERLAKYNRLLEIEEELQLGGF